MKKLIYHPSQRVSTALTLYKKPKNRKKLPQTNILRENRKAKSIFEIFFLAIAKKSQETAENPACEF